jgi:Na+/melibiose symporter-like transporter
MRPVGRPRKALMSMQAQAPKRRVFLTVLLVVITLAQAFAVFAVFMAWIDRIDHGQTAGLQLLFLLLAVVALVAVIGLWFWQRWAVYLFGVLALIGLVTDAVFGVAPVALLVRVALLAALYWQIKEHRESFHFPAS